MLNVLIEARGELVTKDELFRRVWPGTPVEVNTLQFQISTLRKALGPDRDFIKTISGCGYRFIAEIATQAPTAAAPPGPIAAPVAESRDPPSPTNLTAPASDLIGREAPLADLADLVAVHRLVTLVGAGGIGKTRLALALGGNLLPNSPMGCGSPNLACYPIHTSSCPRSPLCSDLPPGRPHPNASPRRLPPGTCCSCSTTVTT